MKIRNTMMAFLLASSVLSGCTKKTAGRNVSDGTYTGTADGFGGQLSAEVTFSDGRISDIEISEEHETTAVADQAMKVIPDTIVAEQSLNIDVCSGATFTGNAVVSAVENAVKAAGGKPEEWKSEEKVSIKTPSRKIASDVTVIGGGAAGLSTALRLQQMGVDTTIVEKEDELGGILKDIKEATQLGGQVFDSDEASTDMEVLRNEIDRDNNSNETLLDILMNHLNDTVEWEIDTLGVPFRDGFEATDTFQQDNLKSYSSSSNRIGELLGKEAEVSGARILFGTGVTDVQETDDGVVVTAKGKDGSCYTITSSYAVIATGSDADSDSDLTLLSSLKKENDTSLLAEKESLSTDKGTVISYGLSLKCEKAEIDMYDIIEKALKYGAFLVNEDGKRFCNEKLNRQDLSAEVLSQKKVSLVLPAKAYESVKNDLLKNKNISKDTKKLLEENQLDGETYAENLSALDPDLTATVADLNESFQQAKEDTSYADSTGRTYFSTLIDPDQTFAVLDLSVSSIGSTGGIRVNEFLNPVKEDGTFMKYVYVVGSACGSVTGKSDLPGVSDTWAFVSGKTVADEIGQILVPDALQKLLAKETGNLE